ncbi:UbiA family prenyltransferase [Thermogutta sp.]|uniref:UbiA family prenyltransferase n=1 Tax=Thermogutta sp. TaxID=1962930 RepID=UPI003220868D
MTRTTQSAQPPARDRRFVGPAESFRAYCQLIRLPNLFTAAADVLAGFFLSHPQITPESLSFLWPLVFAGVTFYAAGVVLNDWVDREIDARERPQRPIPSGTISASVAFWLGWGFLLLGLALSGFVAWRAGTVRPAIAALGLAVAILTYNFLVKRTFLGPAAMGACRGVNFVLGTSLSPWNQAWLPLPVGMAVYVAGITAFARTEADEPHRGWLAAGLATMIAGLAVVTGYAVSAERFVVDLWRWYALLGILAGWMLLRGIWVLAAPSPARVQRVVTQAVMGIIVLDAAVVFTAHGPLGALPVLALILPATWAGRWIAST